MKVSSNSSDLDSRQLESSRRESERFKFLWSNLLLLEKEREGEGRMKVSSNHSDSHFRQLERPTSQSKHFEILWSDYLLLEEEGRESGPTDLFELRLRRVEIIMRIDSIIFDAAYDIAAELTGCKPTRMSESEEFDDAFGEIQEAIIKAIEKIEKKN